MPIFPRAYRRGVTLIEVIVAVSILAVVMTGVLMALFANAELMQMDREYVVAANLARQKLAEIKSSPFFNGNLQINGVASAPGDTIFARYNRVTTDDPAVTVGNPFPSRGDRFLPYIWQASRVFVAGDFIVPVTINAQGFWYEATTVSAMPGQTGGSQPVFPMVEGATVVDNNITWTCRRNVLTPPAGQTQCGTVIFPALLAGGADALREDQLTLNFGLDVNGDGTLTAADQLDLDGNSALDTASKNGNYVILPVVVRVQWRSYGGDLKTYNLHTILTR